MRGKTRPPAIDRDIESLKRRVSDLERMLDRVRRGLELGSVALATTMIRRSSDQTIPSSSDATYPTGYSRVDFDRIVRDDLGNASLDSDGIGVTRDGLYLVTANVAWRPEVGSGALGSGNRGAIVGRNGSILIAQQMPAVGLSWSTAQSLSTITDLASGDFLVLDVLQNSGGGRALEANGLLPYLAVTLLRTSDRGL